MLRINYFTSFKNQLMERAKNISTIVTSYGKYIYINSKMLEETKKSGTRIIIVDKNKMAVFDSYNYLSGVQLRDLEEIQNALKGNPHWSKHITENENLLYVCYPISYEDKNIAGAVLLINSLNDVYNNVNRNQTNFIIISFFLLIIGIMLSYIKTSSVTQPLEEVINAIEDISKGNTNKLIDVKGNDEIARLCHSFNKMNNKLKKMDEERRQFVADASHELKSPLASIKVLVQSLLSGAIDNKKIAIEFLQDIDSEIDRLTGIVNNLLELTKLENDKNIEISSFDIYDLCKDVVKKLYPLAKIKNIEIRLDLKNVFIEGNKDNLFRAMYNILENAIKYSKENSIIDFFVEEDNKNNLIKINIKDYGIGIPKEDLEHIFKRFYRVDKTRDRKTGGSGLGLSIAYDIIKLHKGDIKVYSKVGEGCHFVIILPYKLS